MKTDQIEHAASGVVAGVTKLAIVWGAVATGFTNLPWAEFAAAAGFFYSLHLIVGWWLDRLGKRQPPNRRNNRKTP